MDNLKYSFEGKRPKIDEHVDNVGPKHLECWNHSIVF
jgi:hypothetical protein